MKERKNHKKMALVTGASSGIGKCFARQLAAAGYDLVLIARRENCLKKLSRELEEKTGVKCYRIVADLSQREECVELLKKVKDMPVHIFINNAGFGDFGAFVRTDLDKEMNMIDVNIKAMHLLMKGMLRKMEKQGYGYILNVASSAGLLPGGPYMATYYATKAYVVSLTRAVAREGKEKGSNVYVGALCPGPVNTSFNEVAKVEFALPGISPEYCVRYALRQMKRRKIIIVPKMMMKGATTFSRFLPQSLVLAVTAHQQKKKM